MAPRKAKTSNTQTSSLLKSALSHASVATKLDHDYGKFAKFEAGWLTCFDGVIAAGHSVTEQFSTAVQADVLRAALDRVGSPYSLTLLDDGSLVVRGERLRATVPGVDPGTIPGAGPDRPAVIVDKHLIFAMQIAASLPMPKLTENARVFETSIVVSPQHVFATNGRSILKVNHPCHNVPGWYQVPKEAINAIGKTKDEVTHFGFGPSTITLWYTPTRWTRTQLYQWNFPDVDAIIYRAINNQEWPIYPIQRQLYDALDTLAPFIIDDTVHMLPGSFRTLEHSNSGASYEIDHGFPTMSVAYNDLKRACLYGNQIRFTPEGHVWAGDTVTGLFVNVVRR